MWSLHMHGQLHSRLTGWQGQSAITVSVERVLCLHTTGAGQQFVHTIQRMQRHLAPTSLPSQFAFLQLKRHSLPLWQTVPMLFRLGKLEAQQRPLCHLGGSFKGAQVPHPSIPACAGMFRMMSRRHGDILMAAVASPGPWGSSTDFPSGAIDATRGEAAREEGALTFQSGLWVVARLSRTPLLQWPQPSALCRQQS